MTIEELINQLKQYDPKLPVMLSGYEGGLYEANGTNKVTVAKGVNQEWYYGPHEIVHPLIDDYPKHEKFQGVYIK